MYPYGLIGNGACSALVSQEGSVDWLCLPRPDSEPVFGRLLDPEGGHFAVGPAGPATSTQAYLGHTNLLETRFELADGSAFRIIDLCPRFAQFGRIYRPLSLFRIVEPLRGRPFIKASASPVQGWSRKPMVLARGNSHLRFERGGDYLRLATNLPLTYLTEGASVGLDAPLYFALTWNAPLEEDLAAVARDFERRTAVYWDNWVKHCDVPSSFQAETIRSALALKLHCHEDTGAILAALSTSLPEAEGGMRNWDYRYCWLRDAYFCLTAFHRLGHFEEMEGFLRYLLDLAQREQGKLKPVYRLDQTAPLPELEMAGWRGWQGSAPVRSGNQAAEHVQNDVYGEMILALAPLFLDERFASMRQPSHERLVADLARRCVECVGQPDAGIWELRSGWRPNTFTHLMHWAGLDRTAELRRRGFLSSLELDLEPAQARIRAVLQEAVHDGALGVAPGDPRADTSLLLAPMLRYPDQALCLGTVEKIRRELRLGEGAEGFLYRYAYDDDFGRPEAAFVVCSFWLVQALSRLGRRQEARAAMVRALEAAGPLGLLAEHFDPKSRRQTGNFPQAYSHVGLIHAAFAVSEPWEEVL